MQTRPYDTKDGDRVWLSREEQQLILDSVEEQPKRRIAFGLGLSGLRTDEIINVVPSDVRALDGEESHVLTIQDGKTGKREVPIYDGLTQRITMLKNATGLRKDDPLIEVSKRSLRNWITDARDVIECPDLGMHDLRRTWATDTFYSLAFNGIPIAEELTMSWGGWKMTATGRETFRENYLGPVPDHIVRKAVSHLGD